jgi:hypothetical protein
MWQRPDQCQDPDPDPDATVEFPAVTGDPPGWRVRGEQSADGWVEITIIELTEGELSGTTDAEGAQADAAARREAS